MIKLPIKLKTRPEWNELLGEAIGIRNGLEKAAERSGGDCLFVMPKGRDFEADKRKFKS